MPFRSQLAESNYQLTQNQGSIARLKLRDFYCKQRESQISTRIHKITKAGRRSLKQENMTLLLSYEAIDEEDYEAQDKIDDSIAFKTSGNSDTMCYYQARKALDWKIFIKAIIKEVNDHIK